MNRFFFVVFFVVFAAALFSVSGCTVFLKGETEGDLAVAQAQADAIRAYGRQYRPDNLDVAASPFDTSRRIEIQAPPGTSVSTYGGYHPGVSSGW